MHPGALSRAKSLSATKTYTPSQKIVASRPQKSIERSNTNVFPSRKEVLPQKTQRTVRPTTHVPQQTYSYHQPQVMMSMPMYASPYVYTPYYSVPYPSYPQYQPYLVQYPFQQAAPFQTQKVKFSTRAQEVTEPAPSYNYTTPSMPALLNEFNQGTKLLDVHMGAQELYKNIMAHLNENEQCKLSWLHRLLAKCTAVHDFDKALQTFLLYLQRGIDTTPETATLLIKAACRAGRPMKALELLKDIHATRMYPTLGGVHYLMINFSLLRRTNEVLETFEIAKQRGLKPTQRTFHILIRECVDNDKIADAMKFAEEAKQLGIYPNRVTYNILMNGCRKFNKPNDILELRKQMNENNVEINDTTVKFTALAHMMLGNVSEAVKEFKAYPELETKMEEFSEKFFEVTEGEAEQEFQNKCVVDLFNALKNDGMVFPKTVEAKLKEVEASLKKP